MKFKYMLRGLGIGMAVTAAVMGAYTRNAVADARVAVLKEYGIGEEPTLVGEEEVAKATEVIETETTTESVSEAEETIPVIVRDEPIESELESVIEAAKAAEMGNSEIETLIESGNEAETESSEVAPAQEDTQSNQVSEFIEITISKGDDSGTVSRKLYNAGVVDSASEFDAYLMQHGYDKKITVGKKTIYATDTWQDIATKLAK